MSEKEIIDIIKDFLELREIHSSDDTRKSYLSIYQEAIQGLLDLYKKQKEKDNKMVVAYGGRRYNTEGIFLKEYISKDKIRNLLEEYEGTGYYEVEKVLEELLGDK